MKNHKMTGRTLKYMMLAGIVLTFPGLANAQAAHPSSFVISNDPLPQDVQNRIYNKPFKAEDTTAAQITEDLSGGPAGETAVGHKVDQLRSDLFALQNRIGLLSERLDNQEHSGEHLAAEYYAAIATINTQLQIGTTPGNPRMIEKLTVARTDLDRMAGTVSSLNSMATDVGSAAAQAQYLLQAARAAYSLTGAIDEDHVRLAKIEDATNGTVVAIDRMLNSVNDDLTRTAAYVATERENLRTLSLAVETGDQFGKSLANRPFSNPTLASFNPNGASQPSIYPATAEEEHYPIGPASTAPSRMSPPPAAPVSSASTPSTGLAGKRPLVKIRFDHPDVAYEQPLYMAVNEALERYPNARFELVAVHPNTGNAAEVAIESTRARRDAERVLRSLTQMGLSLDRIDLSYMPSNEATSDEVHLFVR